MTSTVFRLILLASLLYFATLVSCQEKPPLVGGVGKSQPINEEVKALTLKSKCEIEKEAGKTFATFEPVEYATQLVAGTNYFVKIHVGSGSYIHARIYRDLEQNVYVHSVQTGLGATDPLQYF